MIAIERFINVEISLNNINYEKIDIPSFDSKSNFLRLNLSKLSNFSEYKMFIHFILPFPYQNIISEYVENLTEEVVFEIPRKTLMYTGKLEIEFSFYNEIEKQYLTIPKRISFDILETINNSETGSIIPGETYYNSIDELFDKINNLCNSKISETETELLNIVQRIKDDLSDLKSNLTTELESFNDQLNQETLENLNDFIDNSKNEYSEFVDSTKLNLTSFLEDKTTELNSIIESHSNNIDVKVNSITESLEQIQNNTIQEINQLKEEITNNINNLHKDFINRIGTNDDSMYNQITPSIRKELLDHLKNHKNSLIEEIRKESLLYLKDYISSIRENRFSIELDPYITQITLPASFILNEFTKVYINGHLLLYKKDYLFDLTQYNCIHLKESTGDPKTVIVIENIY